MYSMNLITAFFLSNNHCKLSHKETVLNVGFKISEVQILTNTNKYNKYIQRLKLPRISQLFFVFYTIFLSF